MRSTLLATIVVILLLSVTVNGQMNYVMEKTTGTYTTLTGGNNFRYISNPAFLNENFSLATPIGFSFNYNSQVFDSFQVSTNGFIRMGSGLGSSGNTNSLNSLIRRIIAPLWDDLQAQDTNSIQYLTSGTAPNRVLSVDFKRVKWSTGTGYSSFMIKLYETTNVIEFIYGTINPAPSISVTIGMSSNQAINASGSATGTNGFLSVNIGADSLNPSYHQSMSLSYDNIPKTPLPGTLLRFTQVSTPIATGTYTVGATGDFKTISDMVIALNTRGILGPVTFLIQNGTYDDFMHLSLINGTSATNTITIKPANGATVTLSPTNGSFLTNQIGPFAGEAILRLAGVSYTTIEGVKIVHDPRNTTTATRFEHAITVTGSSVSIGTVMTSIGSKYNTFRKIEANMAMSTSSTPYGVSTGIILGAIGSNFTDSIASVSYNTFEDIKIEDFGAIGVYLLGASDTNPDTGNKITATTGRNFIGNVNFSGTSGVTTAHGIFAYKQKDLTIEKTDIGNILISTFGGGNTSGINLNSIDAPTFANQGEVIVRNNRIFNIKQNPIPSSPAATSGVTTGILSNRVSTGSTVTISGNEIYNLESNMPGNSTKVNGILCNAGTSNSIIEVAITNNVISDLKSSNSISSVATVNGIEVKSPTGGGSNIKLAHNTVLVTNNLSVSAVVYSTCLYLGDVGLGKVDLKNNIFINNSTPGTSGQGTAVLIGAVNTSGFYRISDESNYNIYYFAAPSPNRGVSAIGTVLNRTLTDHVIALWNESREGTRDYNSTFSTIPFINSMITPFDLRVSTTTPTQASNAGIPVAGVTTDLDGNVRSSTSPDIGAFEFTGIDNDKTSPYLSMKPFSSSVQLGQTLTFKAAVRDRNGVATAGNSPRVWFKTKGAVSFVSQAGTLVTPDTVSFTIDPVLANASANDTLQVYIAAQDNLPSPNGGTYPYGGAGINPPGGTSPETFYELAVMAGPLSGNYTIGLTAFNRVTGKNLYFKTNPASPAKEPVLMEGGNPYQGSLFASTGTEAVYATMAAAIDDYNRRGISANTNFLLVDTAYVNATALGLNTISTFTPSETAKLRIAPAAGVNTTIRGPLDASIFYIFNSWIEFDGSNTPGGSTRNLTILLTGTNQGSGGIIAAGRGIVLKNLNIGSADTLSGTGISLNFAKNSYVTNNFFYSLSTGIQAWNDCDSIYISKNIIGGTNTGLRIGREGIYMRTTKNFRITENIISGVTGNGVNAVYGIYFVNPAAVASPINGLIDRNHIHDVTHTGLNTDAQPAIGIYLAPNSPEAVITVTNNVISNILSGQKNAANAMTSGIFIQNGGGINVINNSIRLAGQITHNQPSETYSSCIFVNSPGTTGINIMNNILSNRISNPAGGNGTHFGVWTRSASSFTNFNFNLFDTSPGTGRLLYLAGTFVNNRDSIFTLLGKGDFSFVNQPAFADTVSLAIDTQNPDAAFTDAFGYPTGVAQDFNGNQRSVALGTGPVDLGAYEYDMTVEPPLVVPNPPPAPGGLSTYELNGVVIAQIQWGTTGTLPSNMTLAYFGEDPQQTEDIKYYFGKWKLVATGGSNYNYTLKTRISPSSVGNSDTSALKAIVFTDKWYLTGTSIKTGDFISTSGLTAGGLYSLVDASFIAPVPASPANNQLVNSTVTLKWSKANFLLPVLSKPGNSKGLDPEGSVTTYSVQLSSDSLFTSPVLQTTVDTSITLSNLPEGAVRYWRVGVTEKNFFTGYSNHLVFRVKLNTPSNLSAVSTQYNRVTLTWSDNSSAEANVVLERKSGDSTSANNYSVVATLPANTVAFQDTTVSGSTGYTYRVKMTSQGSNSDYSNQAQVVTLVPVELSSFTSSFEGTGIKLNWVTASEKNNRGFEIERKLNGDWQKIAFIEGRGTTTGVSNYAYDDNLRFISWKGTISYRLKQIDFDGSTAFSPVVAVEVDLTPTEFALFPNYPNPFNPSTVIKYALPSDSKVSLKVYSLNGELLADLVNSNQPAGYHDMVFNAANLSSGVYLYVIDAAPLKGGNSFRQVKKMVLMK
ncbi:MAG: hypothetical protein LCH52_14210 [Bacteroidetes bacterium]|nr:hypothetical protein [Bacteroidota bacterium]